MQLIDEIKDAVATAAASQEVKRRYLDRLLHGTLTRVDDPVSHFCTYFLPYDVAAKKVFIVAHKKAGIWLTPGGHIEPGETLFECLTREIQEELGIVNPLPKDSKPQLLTVTDIVRDPRACKVHFDLWYFLPHTGDGFNVDMSEFNDTRWVSIDEARSLMTDQSNLRGMDFVESKLFN